MNPRRRLHPEAGLSLIGTALFAMAVAALAMLAIFYFRYQSLPWQDNWGYWLKAQELKPAPGNTAPTVVAPNQALRPAATVNQGIKRCQIDGKTVYSDTLCDNQGQNVKLHDNVVKATPTAAAAEASASQKNNLNPRLNPD